MYYVYIGFCLCRAFLVLYPNTAVKEISFGRFFSEQLRQSHAPVNSCTMCTLGLPLAWLFLVLYPNTAVKEIEPLFFKFFHIVMLSLSKHPAVRRTFCLFFRYARFFDSLRMTRKEMNFTA